MSGDVSQYGHAKWTLRDGGLPGYPRSIAQTRDGFLWLATDFDLQRFDGVRFTSWEPPPGSSLPGVPLRLLATRDGSLWIGTDRGLARWNDGVLSAYRELDGEVVLALAEDRHGAVWAGTHGGQDNARLCSIQGENVDCDDDGGRLGRFVLALHEDAAGELWVGADTGLWRWGQAAPTQHAVAGSLSTVNALVDDGRGAVVVTTTRQLALPVPHKCFAGLRKAPSLACQHAGCALWRGLERLRGPPVTAPGARLRPDRAMIFVFATSETGTRCLHARYKSSREMWGKGRASAARAPQVFRGTSKSPFAGVPACRLCALAGARTPSRPPGHRSWGTFTPRSCHDLRLRNVRDGYEVSSRALQVQPRDVGQGQS